MTSPEKELVPLDILGKSNNLVSRGLDNIVKDQKNVIQTTLSSTKLSNTNSFETFINSIKTVVEKRYLYTGEISKEQYIRFTRYATDEYADMQTSYNTADITLYKKVLKDRGYKTAMYSIRNFFATSNIDIEIREAVIEELKKLNPTMPNAAFSKLKSRAFSEKIIQSLIDDVDKNVGETIEKRYTSMLTEYIGRIILEILHETLSVSIKKYYNDYNKKKESAAVVISCNAAQLDINMMLHELNAMSIQPKYDTMPHEQVPIELLQEMEGALDAVISSWDRIVKSGDDHFQIYETFLQDIKNFKAIVQEELTTMKVQDRTLWLHTITGVMLIDICKHNFLYDRYKKFRYYEAQLHLDDFLNRLHAKRVKPTLSNKKTNINDQTYKTEIIVRQITAEASKAINELFEYTPASKKDGLTTLLQRLRLKNKSIDRSRLKKSFNVVIGDEEQQAWRAKAEKVGFKIYMKEQKPIVTDDSIKGSSSQDKNNEKSNNTEPPVSPPPIVSTTLQSLGESPEKLTAEDMIKIFEDFGYEIENPKKLIKQLEKRITGNGVLFTQRKRIFLRLMGLSEDDQKNTEKVWSTVGIYKIIKFTDSNNPPRIIRENNTILSCIDHNTYDRLSFEKN